MALFKKKKAEPVVAYSEIEQGVPPPPPKPCACENCQHFGQVLENQKVQVANQQVILDAVSALHQTVVKLAGEPSEEVEEEPTEEEMKAALALVRKKRGK